MSDTTIEWTGTPLPDGTIMPGYTFNPWIGCAKVSDGCKHCYAEVDTFARVQRGRGLELWGVNAARHVTSDANWRKPFKWNREAQASGIRRRVFCASLGDVFEERPDLEAPRANLAALIALTPHLDWLILTKRPENMRRLWHEACGMRHDRAPCVCGSHGVSELCGDISTATGEWAPNIWAGCTVENQPEAERRITHLLRVPAAVRFLSVEPMLGPVTFDGPLLDWLAPFKDTDAMLRRTPRIDWVIVGGESGPKARPFDLAWARAIVSQCKAAGVPVFVKQMGSNPMMRADSLEGRRAGDHPEREWPLGTMFGSATGTMGTEWQGRRAFLKEPHGRDMAEWPEDMRVREHPVRAS